jgi:hypothetical protein
MSQHISKTAGQTPIWGDAKTIGKLYGISRTPLYRLMATGRIKTTSLLDDGASRGKRLFHLPSLEAFLESKATGGMEGGKARA